MRNTILFALLFLPCAVHAQLQINLDGLAEKAKESVDITLDSNTLQLAGKFLSSPKKTGDAAVQKLISGLKAIVVKNFEFAQEGQYRQEDLQPIRAQLRAPAWSRIVSSKSGGESNEIYTKSEQGQIVGLAILAAEPKELTVVYIDGAIDLGSLSELGGRFGIPPNVIPGTNLVPGKNKEKPKGKQ
jgi:hypothetical protein